MDPVKIGQRPPTFRLPAGRGGEVSLEDYRGRNVIVWFTKGMGCPFCRTQMSQLARGYPKLRAADAEILQVTPTRPERARFYAERFPIPFPYLCDPDYRVHRAWGLAVRSHSLPWYAKLLYTSSKMPKPSAEIGDPKTTLAELPAMLHDSDMGFFILDRDGLVRYKRATAYASEQGMNEIPSVEEVLAQLEHGASTDATPQRPA